jgi:type III restriction enzyme
MPKKGRGKSEQLESGEALDEQFRTAAAAEIELFRREMAERNSSHDGEFTDQELLREVIVGKPGRLGESIRW